MSDEEKKDLKKSKPVDKGEASAHRKAQKLAAQKSAKVKNRKPLRAIFPLAGLIAALLAGGIGGFVSHEYFDAPPPPPDLSAFKAQIEDLDEAVKV